MKEINTELLYIFFNIGIVNSLGYIIKSKEPKRKLTKYKIIDDITGMNNEVRSELHSEIIKVFQDTDIENLEQAITYDDLILVVHSDFEF